MGNMESPLSAVARELQQSVSASSASMPIVARGLPTIDTRATAIAAEPADSSLAGNTRDVGATTATSRHVDSSSPPPGASPHPSKARTALKAVESGTEDTVMRFLVGGVAGATAKTIIAPLDRMKIIFQISNIPFSLRAVWRELLRTGREEGVRALFRGNGAQMLRVYPYSGIQLMAFDQYCKLLVKEKTALASTGHKGGPKPQDSLHQTAPSQLSPLERMLAGSAAGATSVAATYPLDCLRARMAVQQETEAAGGLRYKGVWHALRSMAEQQGLSSLYRGMAPTLLGILPYAGISFATYETLKQYSRDRSAKQGKGGDSGQVPTWQRLLFGGIAGLSGQASTYPLDIVRRRMQTEGFSPLHAHAQPSAGAAGVATSPTVHSAFAALRASGRRGGMLDVLGRIYHTEGSRGLFKGLSMNAIKGPIAVGVSFTTYDALKRLLGIEGGAGGHRG